MRRIQYRLTETRSGVYALNPTNLDENPGPLDSITSIVRVEGIPDGVRSEDITRLLSRKLDFKSPPPVITWEELNS